MNICGNKIRISANKKSTNLKGMIIFSANLIYFSSKLSWWSIFTKSTSCLGEGLNGSLYLSNLLGCLGEG